MRSSTFTPGEYERFKKILFEDVDSLTADQPILDTIRKLGWVPENDLARCRAEFGEAKSFGDMTFVDFLVRCNALTPARGEEVCRILARDFVVCRNCDRAYPFQGQPTEVRIRCLRCGEELPREGNSGSASASPKDRVGKYRLLRSIGRGGMGEVFEAEDPDLKRRIAIKLVRGEGATPQLIARLHREAATAARLRHPNIVGVHEVGTDGSVHYIVMDLVDGCTLEDLLARGIERPELLRILVDVARAAAFAHSKGIVHRDLKPANILVDRAGRVLLTDFGLARGEGIEGALTLSHQIMGTPHYMAPEQARGDRETVGERTDVYAAGAILYEGLTGRPPHHAKDLGELYYRIQNDSVTAPRKLRRDIPWELEAIALRALEKHPSRRYPSMAALADDLESYRNHRPIVARRIRWMRQGLLLVRRHRGVVVTLAASLLVLATISLWSGWLRPKLEAARRERRLQKVRDQARTHLLAEVERLRTAPPDQAIRDAKPEQVLQRLLRRLEARSPEERAVVEELLRGYDAGPILSRAYHDRREWPLAYRYDPSGRWGLDAQLHMAREFLRTRRSDMAERFLRRLWIRYEIAEAAPLLAQALQDQGRWSEAAAVRGVDAGLLLQFAKRRQSISLSQGLGGKAVWREPIRTLALDHPRILLPFREGRPAFEIQNGKLVRAPSPLEALDPEDRVIDVASLNADADPDAEIVAIVERSEKGGGFVLLDRTASGWRVALQNLSSPTQPIALAAGESEALILFKYDSPEHWIVRFPEGRVETFHPGGDRPWAFTPRIGDFDGDGRTEWLLTRSIQIGGEVQFFREGTLLDREFVGEPAETGLLPGGWLAVAADIDPAYLTEAQKGYADDSLTLLRWSDSQIAEVVRYPLSRGDPMDTRLRSMAVGRIAGAPVVAVITERQREETGMARPEGHRLRILHQNALHEWGVAGSPGSIGLADLDGDGDSEMLLLLDSALEVYGRGSASAEVPPAQVPEPARLEEAGTLLQVSQDLADFDSFGPAKEVLDDLLRRFPGSVQAWEARLLLVELLLRETDAAQSASAWETADRFAREAASRAREFARSSDGYPEARRNLYRLAAEACRRSLDWEGYCQNRREATETGRDDRSLELLSKMTERILVEGDFLSGKYPLRVDFPERVRSSEIVVDSHSQGHVVGVPVYYGGGALAFEADVEWKSSCWSASIHFGVMDRDRCAEPARFPGALHFFLHGTTAWDDQGATVRLHAGNLSTIRLPLGRYRGRWKLRYSYVPEANLVSAEIRDSQGSLLHRAQTPLRTHLPAGQYLFGIAGGFHGDDGLLGHPIHPPVTRVRFSDIRFWAANPATVLEREPPRSPADRAASAGGHRLRGDLGKSNDSYESALTRDPTLHLARVHLALGRDDPAPLREGFDIDPYGCVLALEDALRGAPEETLRALGKLLRRILPQHPGICFSLLGDFDRALPHLQGADAVSRYLRYRGRSETQKADWDWLTVRSLRTPGGDLPQIYWAPEGEDSVRELSARLARHEERIRSDSLTPSELFVMWIDTSRALLLNPLDAGARLLRGNAALLLGMDGHAELDWRIRTEESDRKEDWLRLAFLYARRRASMETLECLEVAARRGELEAALFQDPAFGFLSKQPRWGALQSK